MTAFTCGIRGCKDGHPHYHLSDPPEILYVDERANQLAEDLNSDLEEVRLAAQDELNRTAQNGAYPREPQPSPFRGDVEHEDSGARRRPAGPQSL